MAGRALHRTHWPITPEIHDRIKHVYHTDSGNGQVRALSKALGYPRWKLSRYAIVQGWIAKQKKEPDWTEQELNILERNAYLCPERIQIRLKRQGFKRTATGIVLKRKRMKMIRNLDGMSATHLAECLGVDVHFVTRAIEGGHLRAQHRETARTEIQGGDIWYIRPKFIRDYIKNWLNEIDIRKVDKWWFCNLLLGK